MRSKTNEWRLFGAAGFLTVAAFLVMATGCATARGGVSGYDGEMEIPPTYEDSVTLIPVTISNNRNRDITAPRFHLLGLGRHDLGYVQPMHTVRKLVDRNWFGTDGCVKIVAHWVGAGDWTSQEFCLHRGETVSVNLEAILSTSNAWAHR